jgi:hypothetical protein
MSNTLTRITFCLPFLLASATGVIAQKPVTGTLTDSLTRQPLYNVNITVKNSNTGTVSDIRGYFSIYANDADTLVFSSVGYKPKRLNVREVRELFVIFLAEENKVLSPIVIEDKQILPWLPKLPPESPWQNSTADKSFTEAPGFRGVQTFGPGYILPGPISRFSKYEKERKKLKKTKEENYQSRNYVQTVNDPEVKGEIMKEYNLTEERYYMLLALFNEQNKDIIYQLEVNDLIALLLIFYAENADKK